MDDSTRYWIGLDLADSKHGHNAEKLFENTVNQIGKYPNEMVDDGLNSYRQAANKVFRDVVKHTREIHITGFRVGKDNNNVMERLNGMIRDRERTYRGCKSRHTVNFKGLPVQYNRVMVHGELKMTPGGAAGIIVEGNDKWMTMIQNGSLFLTKTRQRA